MIEQFINLCFMDYQLFSTHLNTSAFYKLPHHAMIEAYLRFITTILLNISYYIYHYGTIGQQF